ncbi:hypothetical protein [Sodalis praecaptivus]|uniref:hypothetical protein n=1 Tax=Sodalis praecaptivus TaxID=1239307 RepID=UPI00046D5218|nr:hypothetical protein [Sodalis praecaptivus]
MKSIHHILSKEIKASHNKNNTLTNEARMYFFSHVVGDEIPSLALNKKNNHLLNNKNIILNDISWGFLHAGMLFARDVNINTQDWSENDIITLGQYVLNFLQESVAPELFIGYFLLPAQVNRLIEVETPHIHFALNEVTSVMSDKCVAEYIFNRYLDNISKEEDIFSKLDNEINSYQNRTEIARKILKEHGLDDESLTSYMNGHIVFSRFYKHATLPDLNDVFSKQNKRIGESFAKVDRFLMTLFWNDIVDKKQKEFIASAEVEDLEAYYDNYKYLVRHFHQSTLHSFNPLHKTMLADPRIDLFRASNGYDTRHYMFYLNEGVYKLMVVGELENHASTFMSEKQYREAQSDDSYKLTIRRTGKKKKSNESIEDFISLLTNKHKDYLIKSLYVQGYDKTKEEKVLDFFLDLIPFYTCITKSLEGNKDESLQSCVMDSVMFLLTLETGNLSNIARKLSYSIEKSALLSIRHALIKKSITSGFKHLFSQKSLMPSAAGIKKNDIIGVGVDMLRSLDPGVEIITCISRGGIKKLVQLTDFIKNDFSKKISSSLNKIDFLEFSSSEHKVEKVFFKETKEIKYLIPIDKEGNTLVSVNPYTGEKFGYKYIKRNGQLIKIDDVLYQRNTKKHNALFMEQDNFNHQHEIQNVNFQNAAIDITRFHNLPAFIEPMTYWRANFGVEIRDRTEELLTLAKEGYKNPSTYLHNINDAIDTIPMNYEFLRTNLYHFNIQINAAYNEARVALKKIKSHTRFNAAGKLTYAEKNPIKSYISTVLNTKNDDIIRESITRLHYHTERIVNYFNKPDRNIIFATCTTRNQPYIYREECPLGFTLPADSKENVVIMVDNYHTAPNPSTQMHLTALHEASHISGTLDFLIAPSRRYVGDASEFMEAFDDAINFRNGEAISFDPLFFPAYGRHQNAEILNGFNFFPNQASELISRDPMLKANIFLENADFIARMISDIAMGRKANVDYRRTRDINERTLNEDKFGDIKYLLLKLAMSSSIPSENDKKHFIKC